MTPVLIGARKEVRDWCSAHLMMLMMTLSQEMMEEWNATMQTAKEELKIELVGQLEGANPDIGEIFKVLNTSLGPKDQAEIDDLIGSRGMSQEDVVKHFLNGGFDDKEAVQMRKDDLKLEIEEQHANGSFSTSFIMNTLRNGLGPEDQMKIDALLKSGASMEQVIGYFLEGALDQQHFEIDVETGEEENKRLEI